MQNAANPNGTLIVQMTARRLLDAMRRRRKSLWGTFILVVGTGAAVSAFIPPVYQATSRLEIQPVANSQEASQALENVVDPARRLQTQVELIKSQPVLDRAAGTLKIKSVDPLREAIAVRLVRDTQLVEVTARHGRPATARSWADAVAEGYLAYRRDRAVAQTLLVQEDLTRRLNDLKAQITALDKKIAGGQVEMEAERNLLLVRLGVIESERQALPEAEGLKVGGGTIIEQARLPHSPVRPNWFINMGLATAVGLLAGIGLALLRERLDDRIESIDELENITGAPLIGSVPAISSRTSPKKALVMFFDPGSPAAEAHRTLRTNLKFLSPSKPLRTLMITSALPSEGKSTTAANLGAALAEDGTNTVLMTVDLRRHSTIEKALGLAKAPGLLDAMDGRFGHEAALNNTGLPLLSLIPAGGLPPNPAELLGSEEFARLTESILGDCDLLILDAPPVLGLADASVLASRVDGVVMVVNPGEAGRGAVGRAAIQIRRAGGQILGVVAVGVAAGSDYGYYGLARYPQGVFESYEAEEPTLISSKPSAAKGKR